jgi:phytoene dehydrogenase-like protein
LRVDRARRDVLKLDAVVVGSGPNGLAAAVTLAKAGLAVRVLEAHETVGGGTRNAELTLPGFVHDVCSGVHPLGYLSPGFSSWPLAGHGLTWVHPPASVAHPLPGGRAVLLERSLDATAERLGRDGAAYRRLIAPFLREPDSLMGDLLTPPSAFPKRPLRKALFGWYGLRPAQRLATTLFADDAAQALFAGCAAHSILPLESPLTAAIGLIFAVSGHIVDWPLAQGGSHAITKALASYLGTLGGEVETGRSVQRLDDLPAARAYVFDLAPRQLADIAGSALPGRYVRRLRGYRYGPGVFKLDLALDGPIPWDNADCGKASTVHVGGTLSEIAAGERAVWAGQHPDAPFVLVCQQSHFDRTRAPEGKHTGYACCHVPNGSSVDMTDRIESQIERFARGFRDRILARHATTAAGFERYSPSFVGGAITGGAADIAQFFARPVARLDPYSTPNPAIFLCSASTPPGGGVHGMCGVFAARSVLKAVHRRRI